MDIQPFSFRLALTFSQGSTQGLIVKGHSTLSYINDRINSWWWLFAEPALA
jgi:hypothetical protein